MSEKNWSCLGKKITKNEIRIPSNVLFSSCIFLTPEIALPVHFCVDMETLHMPGSQQLPLGEGVFRTQPRGPTALSVGSPQGAFHQVSLQRGPGVQPAQQQPPPVGDRPCWYPMGSDPEASFCWLWKPLSVRPQPFLRQWQVSI